MSPEERMELRELLLKKQMEDNSNPPNLLSVANGNKKQMKREAKSKYINRFIFCFIALYRTKQTDEKFRRFKKQQ